LTEGSAVPVEQVDQSSLDAVEVENSESTYIATNPWLEELLFDRSLIGTPFSRLCLLSTRAMVSHFAAELADQENVAELILLSKGFQYRLGEAIESVLGYRPQTNFLATSRKRVVGTEVTVEIDYASLDAPARTLIIGDTVASGETVCTALSYYMSHHRLERVLLLSLAGSAVGARRIGRFCAERGVALTIVFGLAAFGLAANGFDLAFLHPETICADRYRARATEVFGQLPVSAVGWDFGSQVQAVGKYRALCWVEAKYWGLEGSDLFAVARQPTDAYQIECEHPAYRDRFPEVSVLLADPG
jgi:hypothetical protein